MDCSAVWMYDYPALTGSHDATVPPPLRGGLQDTSYQFTGLDCTGMVTRLMSVPVYPVILEAQA